MESIFNINIDFNYDIIDINKNGKVLKDNKTWKSKKEFYSLFGESEEFIVLT